MTHTLTTVSFHGTDLHTIEVHGECYIPLKPIVDDMGLDWNYQQDKLVDQHNEYRPKLIAVITGDGLLHKLLCIPLAKLNRWLFSINPDTVKEDLQKSILLYQEECYTTIYNHRLNYLQIQVREITAPPIPL